MSTPFSKLEEFIIGEGPTPGIRRGQPHSDAFKQCVSQRYTACADEFGIRELTRCLMMGTKTSEECRSVFDQYQECLSIAYKKCLEEFIW